MNGDEQSITDNGFINESGLQIIRMKRAICGQHQTPSRSAFSVEPYVYRAIVTDLWRYMRQSEHGSRPIFAADEEIRLRLKLERSAFLLMKSEPLSEVGMKGIVRLHDKEYAKPEALARMLGITTRTLLRWDDRRIGPPRIAVGNLRLYDLSALPDWLEQHQRRA